MSRYQPAVGQQVFLAKEAGLTQLVATLRAQGFTVIAPVVAHGVVGFEPIESADQIARGVNDEQDAGRYRLRRGDAQYFFSYAVGPQGPKSRLFPPRQDLFSVHVQNGAFRVDPSSGSEARYAFLGVRPCELAAVAIQDKVFGVGPGQQTFRCESETEYRTAREQSMLIAVNCIRPGGTCFCASWGTGPAAADGFDLAMTELRDGFVVRVGTGRGARLLDGLPIRPPTSAELELEELRLAQASERMGRRLRVDGLKELLDETIDHPVWEQVAKRCLGCGNCTMVCPTCFCSTVHDTSDLSGREVTRVRQTESCFTHQLSYTTGGPVRASIRARYRHWIRHKLCTWWDQFGSSGCVGCGRCITWCPAAIDLTVEMAGLRTQHRPGDEPASVRQAPAAEVRC
jgi:ferredoxin